MIKLNLISILTIATIVLFSSCEKEDPVIPNEEELITTLSYTLTPDNGGDPIIFSFMDLDGDGGEDPVITGGPLLNNNSYSGTLVLLNETEDPSINITNEILEEALDHQFFYLTDINGLDISYNDTDLNGNPIGISSRISTMEAGTGTLTIVLRHEPDKNAEGVSEGDISNAGGETDIEVIFNVDVQ